MNPIPRIYNWIASITTVAEFNKEIINIETDLLQNQMENYSEYQQLLNVAKQSHDINLKLYVLLLFVSWRGSYARYALAGCRGDVQNTILERLDSYLYYFCHGLTLTNQKFTRHTINNSDRSIEGFVSKVRGICVGLV
jgi:hypothetical protein